MLQPSASSTQAARAVFFIDPESKIRAIHNYALSAGRNFQELKRLLISLQTTDRYGVPTPADWQPGEEVSVPPPGSCGAARERVESKAPASAASTGSSASRSCPDPGLAACGASARALRGAISLAMRSAVRCRFQRPDRLRRSRSGPRDRAAAEAPHPRPQPAFWPLSSPRRPPFSNAPGGRSALRRTAPTAARVLPAADDAETCAGSPTGPTAQKGPEEAMPMEATRRIGEPRRLPALGSAPARNPCDASAKQRQSLGHGWIGVPGSPGKEAHGKSQERFSCIWSLSRPRGGTRTRPGGCAVPRFCAPRLKFSANCSEIEVAGRMSLDAPRVPDLPSCGLTDG